MKRFIPIISAFVVVVSLVAFSAGAVSDGFVDYNNYITDIGVVGEEDVVTFKFPADSFTIEVFNETDGVLLNSVQGSSLSVLLDSSKSYRVTFYSPKLGIDNIPVQTRMMFTASVNDVTGVGYKNPYLIKAHAYFNKNFGFLSQFNEPVGNTPFDSTIAYDFNISEVPNSAGVQVLYQFNYFSPNASAYFEFNVGYIECKCAISSLYRQQQLSNTSNKLLDEINKQLEQNGQKIDDIINGSVSAEKPNGSDAVGDLGNIEDELMDSAQEGMDKADVIFNDAPNIFALYASGFLFMATVIERIASAGWISNIITVSLALGLVAFIVNISMVVVGRKGDSGKGGKT